MRGDEATVDRDEPGVGRDRDKFGFALAEILRRNHHPRVLQKGLIEFVAEIGAAGVFRNIGRGLAEVAARTAASGDEGLLREETHGIGIGGRGEGFDFFNLDVVARDADIEAEVAQRNVVHLEVEAFRVGGRLDEGAEAGAVEGAGGGDEEVLGRGAEADGAVLVGHGEAGEAEEELTLEEVDADAGFGVVHGGAGERDAVAIVSGVGRADVDGAH